MKIEIKKRKIIRFMISILTLSATILLPTQPVAAEEALSNSIMAGNSLILSDNAITVTENGTAAFTAALNEGLDASRLTCVIADPNIVSITPIAYAANVAAFQVNYIAAGSTVAAIVSMDNPQIIAYITVNATPVIMEIPSRLGTNRSNYCQLTSYEYVPYDFTYTDFNDYKYTLNLKYQCTAYNDDDYSKWGCYGYFYDAAGNILSKVHLYCSTLAKGREYHSEFHVPINAVRFSIEGF